MKLRSIGLLTILALALISCDVNVNKNIYIDDSKAVHHSMNSVNGNIVIGENCKIRGGCRTVNGMIEIGARSEVRTMQTVNGIVRVKNGVTVDGDINTVNGSIDCDSGIAVNGDITTVNGHISLANTMVRRNIVTYNGDISLSDSSIVHGDIRIKASTGNDQPRQLKVEIQNSIVKGDIMVRDPDIEVIVYLTRGGEVRGKIIDAQVIRE